MSDLKTEQEYLAIASSLALPQGAYINGKFQPGSTGETIESINPANGSVIGSIAVCDQANIDQAVLKAREAFDDGRWSKMHPSERKKVLIQFCKLLRRNESELTTLETLESGKPIHEVVHVDFPETLHCIEWHAEMADKIYDQVAPAGDDAVAMIVREPVGVVGAVLPWNFPMLMMAWKIGPALAAGNSVIVKPAEETSMTALRMAELAEEAGLPRAVLQVVTGPGEITGQALGLHSDVDMVSFTGSTEVGRLFLKYAAESNLKKVVLECGGKNPCVVLEDAEDLDIVAQHAVNAVLWNMGQNCSSNSRLIVHESLREQLIERIIHRLREWRTGRPFDPANNLGAIVSKKQFDQIMGFIEKGKEQGATLVSGGSAIDLDDGYYIEPTIFADVTTDMDIARDEIFGPVLSIMSVNSTDAAIELANDTCYGLAASVFTSNVSQAHRAARGIKAGTVTVNTYGEGDMSTPFGGYKQSGFGGRDNSIHAHDQYTEMKTIWLDISDQNRVESVDR